MNADTIGLFLNITGALVLAAAAHIQSNVFKNIADNKAYKYNAWGSDKPPDTGIEAYAIKMRWSKILNWTGYLLLISGFGLQIICRQFQCFGL